MYHICCLTVLDPNVAVRFVILGAMHGAWSGLVLPCAPALSTWMNVLRSFEAYLASCQVLVALIVACVLFRFADKEPGMFERLRCTSNETVTCQDASWSPRLASTNGPTLRVCHMIRLSLLTSVASSLSRRRQNPTLDT